MRTLVPLSALALLALGASLAPAEAPRPKKRLLVITESRGFQHDCVRRPKGGGLCLVEKILTEIGQKAGDFEAVCSQDSRKVLTAEELKNFDAVFFYTTGSLPLSDTQKADFISWIRSGKGFAGSHSATDTFYDWPEYGKLIGGYFDGHPWHQKVRVVVEDTKHPATRHLGSSFTITDEIYQYKAPFSRDKLRVLMRLDTTDAEATRVSFNGKPLSATARLEVTFADGKARATLDGKEVPLRALDIKASPQGRRKDKDNALAWTQEYGKGRVFYTALGHRDEVWRDPRFQQHVLGGLRYVMRLEDADATPRPLGGKDGK